MRDRQRFRRRRGHRPRAWTVPSLHRTSTSARSPSEITAPSHRTNSRTDSMRYRPPSLRLLADSGACCRRTLHLTSRASARRRGYMPAPEQLELRWSRLKSKPQTRSPSTDAEAPAHCRPSYTSDRAEAGSRAAHGALAVEPSSPRQRSLRLCPLACRNSSSQNPHADCRDILTASSHAVCKMFH